MPVHITVPLKPEESITEGETAVLHAEVSKPDTAGTWFKDDLEIIPKVFICVFWYFVSFHFFVLYCFYLRTSDAFINKIIVIVIVIVIVMIL